MEWTESRQCTTLAITDSLTQSADLIRNNTDTHKNLELKTKQNKTKQKCVSVGLGSLSERSSAVRLLSSSEWQSTAEEPAEQKHTRQPLHKVTIVPETRQLCQTASLAGRLPTSQPPLGRTVAGEKIPEPGN